MLKTEFLIALSEKLKGLPPEDINEHLNFYAEMINDKIEDGIAEEDAVCEIGTPDSVASAIICDTPLSTIAKKAAADSKKHLSATEIVLIVLGSPIWLALLISAFAVVLSLYAVLWSLVISVWAVFVALALGAPLAIVLGVIYLTAANTAGAAFAAGTALLLLGLAIFTFFGALYATRGTLKLTKRIIFSLKMRLAGKEKA